MTSLGATSKDLVQLLEFLNWLNKEYPKFNITGNIPSEKVTELVQVFCEKVGYCNSSSFSKEVKNWLCCEKYPNILNKLLNIFLEKKRNRDNQNSENKLFE